MAHDEAIDPDSPPPAPGPALPEGTQSQRWQKGKDRPVPPGGYVDASRLHVEPIGFTEARRFVIEHHYAGTYPSDVLRIGMFQRGRDNASRLVGVCVFSTHVNPATSAKWVKAHVEASGLVSAALPVPEPKPTAADADLTPEELARVLAERRAQALAERQAAELARVAERRERAARSIAQHLDAQQAKQRPDDKRRLDDSKRAALADKLAEREERVRRILSGPIKSLDLGRFVLLPEIEGNAETFFLRQSLWHLGRLKPEYDLVISMSDPMSYRTLDGRVISPGHYGGIYVAGGLRHVGRSRPDWRRLDPDGRVVQGRAVSKARGGEEGQDYAIRKLMAWGAPAPAPDEDIGEWVRRALQDGPFRRVKHPGNLVYAVPVGSSRYARLMSERLLPALPPPTSAARVPCPIFLDHEPQSPTLPLTWALP